MKKAATIFLIIAAVAGVAVSWFFLHGAGEAGEAYVDVGTSVRFTEEELSEAVKCVKHSFVRFKDCTMTEIWYSEDNSATDIAAYLADNNVRGISSDNAVVLYSNFNVGEKPGLSTLEPGTRVIYYKWLVVKTIIGTWRVQASGF